MEIHRGNGQQGRGIEQKNIYIIKFDKLADEILNLPYIIITEARLAFLIHYSPKVTLNNAENAE